MDRPVPGAFSAGTRRKRCLKIQRYFGFRPRPVVFSKSLRVTGSDVICIQWARGPSGFPRPDFHFIAWGLIGEPVPPVMMRGGPQKKNS
jgi:hypothetical protein